MGKQNISHIIDYAESGIGAVQRMQTYDMMGMERAMVSMKK